MWKRIHLTGSLLVLFNPGELRSPDSTRLLGEALRILAPQIILQRLIPGCNSCLYKGLDSN